METHSESDRSETSDPDDPQFVWSEVEQGFYAGSCGGNFVGYVDQIAPGFFVAYDMQSRVRGEFSTVDEAIESLTALFSSPEEEEV